MVPKRVQEELAGAKRYFDYQERCIYCDIIRQETETAARIILETDHFVAFAPYAARFPFETWILPKKHSSHFENLRDPGSEEPGLDRSGRCSARSTRSWSGPPTT